MWSVCWPRVVRLSDLAMAEKPSFLLENLPHDVLRRVVDTVEEDITSPSPPGGLPVNPAHATPLKTAHVLAAVSQRLRSYVINSYLPSVATLAHRDWVPLVPPTTDEASFAAAATAFTALLGRCTSLKRFSSEGAPCELVKSEAVAAMIGAASRKLESVDIKYIDVSDEAVRPLFSCPNLTSLQISFCRFVTRELFDFGPGGEISAPLKVLDLTWLSGVDRRAAAHIARIPTLEELYLKNCELFDDECAIMLASGEAAKSLQTLSVSYCPISNESLKMLLRSMPKLVSLLVAERPGSHGVEGAYTQAGIDEAKDEFRNVKIEFDT